ncbi:MAG TPA: endonuclease/exonuclease/phosphatase family protein [Solirubrobacteraceae bacterium]|nr:endonuclease/exonuclease/phosphatase family protein [Solirubrobacteraceae bacterium]
MRVLTWNVFHGRSLPPARGTLLSQFAAKIAGWEWDVALLQEVPPWWPHALAQACGADQRSALTSRNALLPLRRAVAERRPESIKSNGGGCNAILSRVPISEHSTLRLRLWPERRVAQLARLRDGTCVVNFHASTRRARAEHELARLWQHTLAWAGPAPLILGGDLNLREPRAPGSELAHAAAHEVDHLFARGLDAAQTGVLDREIVVGGRRAELSDHVPLWAEVRDS